MLLKKLCEMNWLKKLVQTIDTSDLVKEADYDHKIEDIEKKIHNHDKYITINKFKKFPSPIFYERLK